MEKMHSRAVLSALSVLMLAVLACNAPVSGRPTETPGSPATDTSLATWVQPAATDTPVPTQPPPTATDTSPPSPTPVEPSPEPTPTPLPPPTAQTPAGVFTWAVIVDLDSEPVTREQAQELVNQASTILMRLTGFSYQMVDFIERASPGTVRDLAVTYIGEHAASLPNGIIIFSYGDADQARTYGGYAFSLAGPAGFRNTFGSPVAGDDKIYVSIQHWSHRYARCGYGGSDVAEPVQDTSFNGECRNQDGVPCVERLGYSMCSNAVDDLYASSRTYFGCSVIIHETMHSFGFEGVYDHYGTESCNTRMASGASSRPYTGAVQDLSEFQYYNGMCPDVYDNFVNGYQP